MKNKTSVENKPAKLTPSLMVYMQEEVLQNIYDKFVESILSLPADVRGDVLRIGAREAADGNAYMYLFRRVIEGTADDTVRGLLEEYNLLPTI